MMFIEKLKKIVATNSSLVCVGLDSDLEKIPEQFRKADHPQFEFNKWIIDQTHDLVCAYKPNLAFYEATGLEGLESLQMTTQYLRERYPEIVTIADAKRADIGNTNEGYVKALFDDLQFDAVTVHPYLGREALQPFFDRVDKGIIVLCRTSNPGAGEFQDLVVDGKPLWLKVAEQVATAWNRHKNCLLVVGGTYPEEMKQIRAAVGDDLWFLVPGVGAQGGDVAAIMSAGANASGTGLIINSSRGIIFADDPRMECKKLQTEIDLPLV